MTRFSFSLRDVFWLTLVVGMGIAWWIQSRQWASEKQVLLMEGRYSAALREPLFVRMVKTPLADVTAYLSDTYKIPVKLDEPRLKRIGLTGLSPVTFEARGGKPLEDEIKRMLGENVKLVATENAMLITVSD